MSVGRSDFARLQPAGWTVITLDGPWQRAGRLLARLARGLARRLVDRSVSTPPGRVRAGWSR